MSPAPPPPPAQGPPRRRQHETDALREGLPQDLPREADTRGVAHDGADPDETTEVGPVAGRVAGVTPGAEGEADVATGVPETVTTTEATGPVEVGTIVGPSETTPS